MKSNVKNHTLMICATALFTAMNVAMSSFSVPVPGGHLYLNDIIIGTASVILSPYYAFVAGGVGAFLGDLFFYPRAMFVSLAVHGIQAVVISLISHYLIKDKPRVSGAVALFCGAVIMVIGYTFGRAYTYGTMVDSIAKLPFQILQALVGAVTAYILCYPLGIKNTAYKFGFGFSPKK